MRGMIRKRVQVLNPVTRKWVKIDTSTNKIVAHKSTHGPYKGVRKLRARR